MSCASAPWSVASAFHAVVRVVRSFLSAIAHFTRNLQAVDVLVRGHRVFCPIEGVSMGALHAFVPLRAWLTSLDEGLLARGEATLHGVTVRDAFAPTGRILFLLVEAHVTRRGVDRPLPGVVFLRGASVAVLLWAKRDGRVHVVAVRQPRVPVGREMWEVPAGMLDDKTPIGAAFDEVREETGIDAASLDLVPLGTVASSPGLLDETIDLFAARCDSLLEGVETDEPRGNEEEGEVISAVAVLPADDPRLAEDAKAQSLLRAAESRRIFDEEA
jgi:8-oxo-dGTP pyrophosphatase MutT (NUDIX family)